MIDVFIKRPVFTTMLVMLLVVFGLNSYPRLGIDLYPDVEFPIVMVSVTYTGASPEEMESLITKPIEDAVSSVAGIKTLSSVSRQGVSQTTIEFELGTNAKMVANDVREKVAGVRRRLPEEIDEPVVQRYDITAQSIMAFSLASDSRQRGEIRKIAEDIVKDRLQQLEGVAEVSVYGAAQREIQILADPRKLEAYGLTLQQLLDKIDSNNSNTPGGRVTEKGIELTVRTIGKYQDVDNIRQIVVLNDQGRLVRLYEVASVNDTWGEERTYAATNSVPSVIVSIQKQSGTNTVEVAEKVKQEMQRLEEGVLPQDIKVTNVRDNAVYIRNSVDDVMISMVFGGLLAVAITFLFLRNGRATVIGAIAIPTSVISTFFLMKAMNFTLNNMSLMGLSLAVGILIDDAIVIVENIFRHMEQGKDPMTAAREGTKEISLAVMATTFSILAVFVPVGNMGEIIGQFFKQFGLTVAFSVAFSLFVAFTLTPMLSAHWLTTGHEASGRQANWLERMLDKWEQGFEYLRESYRQVLYWALQRPKKLVVIAIISLFLNALLLPFLGSEFQPTYDSGEFNVNMIAPAGTSIERSKELAAQVEKEVMAIPELKSVYMVVGTNRQVYRSMIGVRLVDTSDRSQSMMQIMDSLRVKFRDINGLKVSVSTGQSQGRGDSRPIQVALRGPELSVLNQYAGTLAEQIKQISGTTDVDISSEQSEPEVQVRFDPARLGDAGLDATTVGKAIQIAFLGVTTKNQYNVADSDYDIRVQLQQGDRLSMADVADLRIGSKNGFVRLGDIAEVKFSSGPTQIDREDRQRQVIVYANAVGTSSGEIIAKVKDLIPGLNLPFGYTHKLVGQAQMMEDSFKEIAKALVLAIILIYMVLAAEFESFIHPFTIMLSLPFSLVGAILGLLISGNTINIMSLIGVIMLMGLVTKNAILLVDYANQLRDQGMPVIDALVEAGSVRLRPILMTTLAMIFGMLPIALGIGAGAEIRSSMGVALIGGLITSTLLTLVIIPLVYLLIDRLQNYFKEGSPDVTRTTPGA